MSVTYCQNCNKNIDEDVEPTHVSECVPQDGLEHLKVDKRFGKLKNHNKELNPNFKHGMAGTRIYGIWLAMKKRCADPNNVGYKRYGGRGIKVCDKWSKFKGFYEDMKEGYADNL